MLYPAVWSSQEIDTGRVRRANGPIAQMSILESPTSSVPRAVPGNCGVDVTYAPGSSLGAKFPISSLSSVLSRGTGLASKPLCLEGAGEVHYTYPIPCGHPYI